jgi:hypothetical protein
VIVLIAQITRETGLRQTRRGGESWEWECHARRRRRQALLLCISFLSMPAVKTPDRSFPSIYMSEYTYVVRNSDKIHARVVTVSTRRTILSSARAMTKINRRSKHPLSRVGERRTTHLAALVSQGRGVKELWYALVRVRVSSSTFARGTERWMGTVRGSRARPFVYVFRYNKTESR